MTASSPAWDDRRLAIILANALPGALDRHGTRILRTHAAAEALGVSDSTIRRWIRHGVPLRRLDDLKQIIYPSTAILEQEQRDLRAAYRALEELAGIGFTPPAQWRTMGWHEPHVVAVTTLQGAKVCVPRVTLALESRIRRGGELPISIEASRAMRRGGAVVTEAVITPNRFAAQIIRLELLAQVTDWRVQIHSSLLGKGASQGFLEEAPRTTLRSHLARTRRRMAEIRRRAAAQEQEQGELTPSS